MGNRQSINEILAELRTDGGTYANDKIYKVMLSKQQVEEEKNAGRQLVKYIAIEASEVEFKLEPAISIYLRDMTKFVQGEKNALKKDIKIMKNAANDQIIQMVA